MANREDNLKPFDSNQSREKAKINGRKGGIRSGEVKRARKTMREMLKYLLEQDITNKKGQTKNTLEVIMLSQIKQAINGNTKAAIFIRDTIGEKPTDKQILTQRLITAEELQKLVDECNEMKDILDNNE